jgi:hypothetical protein
VFLDRSSGRVTRRCQRCERDRKLLSLYGITLDDLELWIDAQGGECRICSSPIDVETARVDHDHACCAGIRSCGECLRGILCDGCNRGIGAFEDNAAALIAAADYLLSCPAAPVAAALRSA